MKEEPGRFVPTGKSDWRPKSVHGPSARPAPSDRGRKLFWLVAVLLALVGAIVGLVLYVRPLEQPRLLALPVAGYDNPLYPSNRVVLADATQLGAFFDHPEFATDSQQKSRILSELVGLSSHKGKALIVYVGGFALMRGGAVYLLPADAAPDDPATWLPLAEVLDHVGASPAPHKLLILDIMRPLADARLGVLEDRVAEGVKNLVTEKAPAYWVLGPCEPGQTALDAEETGESAFGFFLRHGLSGRADGYGSAGRRDGRITVQELADYASEQVDRWAQITRGSRQTPRLLGNGSNFELAVVQRQEPSETPPELPEPPEDFPKLLRDGWALRDAWAKDGGWRARPQGVKRLEDTLLRAERDWRGGTDEKSLQDNRSNRLEPFHAEAAPETLSVPAPLSLKMAVDAGKLAPDDALLSKLRGVVAARLEADRDPKDKDAAKKADAERDAFQKLVAGKELTVLEAAFRVATEDAAGERIRMLAGLIQPLARPPAHAETAALLRLAERDPAAWPAAPGLVVRLLQATRERELAASRAGAWMAWVEKPLARAADAQRGAEAKLFGLKPEAVDLDGARRMLETVEGQYAVVQGSEGALEKANLLLDEALRWLPATASYVERRPVPGATEEKQWVDAARAARQLHQALARPPDDDAREVALNRVREATGRLAASLGVVKNWFRDERAKELLTQADAATATPAEYLEIEAWLTSPLPSLETRIALWKMGQRLIRRLYGGKPPARVDAERIRQLDVARARTRAKLALELLRLGGLQGITNLDALPRSTDAQIETLAEKLRIAWRAEAPAQIEKNLASPDGWAEADCLSRVVASANLSRYPTAGGYRSAAWRRRQIADGQRRLADLYNAESRYFAANPETASVFRQAAEGLLQSASGSVE
jgi:hypothetical protein